MRERLKALVARFDRLETAVESKTAWFRQGRVGQIWFWMKHLLPVVLIGIWISRISETGRMPSGDGPHILSRGMRLAQQLHDFDLWTFFLCLQSLVGPHPPVAYVPSMFSYTLVGTGPEWAHLLGGGFVLWLIWDGLVRFGAGLVGALFCAGTGLIWIQAEGSGVDLIAAACVIQALSHLSKSARLSLRRHVLLWGVWMGLGFLCKYTAPIFMAAPCLLAGWWVVRDQRWKPLGMAVGAFMLVAGVWYSAHLSGVLGYISQSRDAAPGILTNKVVIENPWAADHIGWYPAALIDAWGWPGLICLLIGVAFWGRRKSAPEGAWLIPLLGAGVGILVLMGQSQRQDRYLLPALPLLAVLIGSCRIRWLLAPIGLVGAWCTATIFFQTENAPLTRDYTHSIETAGSDWPWVATAYLPTSLDPEPWRIDHGVDRIRHYHGSDTGTVGFLSDEAGGGPGSGLLLARANRAGTRWDVASISIGAPPGGGGGEIVGVPHMSPFLLDGVLADEWPSRWFMVVLTIIDPSDRTRLAWLQQEGLILQESWPLPNGREGRIYTRPEGSAPPSVP